MTISQSEIPAEKKQSDVLLIIPAYNEADNIERVVDELVRDYSSFDYVVVTDGPTDGTDEICRRRGYNALYLPVNLGLTGCFHRGMVYAHEHGYRFAVQFDGDGQHRPEYIAAMYEKALEGYDIVMGSRFIGPDRDRRSGMGPARAVGSMLIRLVIYLRTGTMVTDPTCGLRMYSARIIKLFASKEQLAPEPYSMVLLMRNGAKSAEVPVHVAKREAGSSYLSPLRAARYMAKTIAKILEVR